MTIDLTPAVKEGKLTEVIDVLTVTSQQHFSDEILACEGKRPSRERIERLYGRCLIEASSEKLSTTEIRTPAPNAAMQGVTTAALMREGGNA